MFISLLEYVLSDYSSSVCTTHSPLVQVLFLPEQQPGLQFLLSRLTDVTNLGWGCYKEFLKAAVPTVK